MGKKAAKKNVFDTCFFSAAAAAETTTDKTFKAITIQKKKINKWPHNYYLEIESC